MPVTPLTILKFQDYFMLDSLSLALLRLRNLSYVAIITIGQTG